MMQKQKRVIADNGTETQVKRAKLPEEEADEVDLETTKSIKLTEVLATEHAVTTLQHSISKIVNDAPDYKDVMEYLSNPETEDTVKKEIFNAMSRTTNVKLASLLKKYYKEGRLKVFDDILQYQDNTQFEFDTDLGIAALESADNVLEEVEQARTVDYPPPLPVIKNPSIVSRVFMHKSMVNDKQYLTQEQTLASHNERLEFLGDSILNNLITLIIFEEFPGYNEGELSKLRIELVNNQTLINWSQLYQFDKKLIKNISNTAFQTGKLKVYADVFEAYVGGLATDNVSMMEIMEWLRGLAQPVLDMYKQKNEIEMTKEIDKGAKAELYSLVGCAAMAPRYEVIQEGNGINIPFIVQCLIKDEELGRGSGPNTKEAGLRAAMSALANKTLIEKYSMIRRQIPRSISVFKNQKDANSTVEQDQGANESPEPDIKGASPAPLSKIQGEIKTSILEPVADHLIDVGSKERLYKKLGQYKIIPEYETKPGKEGHKVVLKIANKSFVESHHRSSKLAGQRAAQYLLENPQILSAYGISLQ